VGQRGAKLSTHVSSVKNLQLSVGQLQFPAHPQQLPLGPGVKVMTWREAEKFCSSNRSKTLPIITNSAAYEQFASFLQQLPSELQLCPVWLDQHTSQLDAFVRWRWMDKNTTGCKSSSSTSLHVVKTGLFEKMSVLCF